MCFWVVWCLPGVVWGTWGLKNLVFHCFGTVFPHRACLEHFGMATKSWWMDLEASGSDLAALWGGLQLLYGALGCPRPPLGGTGGPKVAEMQNLPQNLKIFVSRGAWGVRVIKKVVLRGSDTKLDLPEVS